VRQCEPIGAIACTRVQCVPEWHTRSRFLVEGVGEWRPPRAVHAAWARVRLGNSRFRCARTGGSSGERPVSWNGTPSAPSQ